MANYFASASGNFHNSAIWSNFPTGSGGAGVPGSGDNAYSNNKSITITSSLTCAKLSTEAENGATGGGGYTVTATGVTINANLVSGTVVGTVLAVTTTTLNAIVNVNGNVTAGAGYGIYFNPTANCTLNVVGNVLGGTSTSVVGILKFTSGTINVTGTVSARNNVNSARGIDTQANVQGPITVIGDVFGSGAVGASGCGINIGSINTTLTVVGNVYGGYYGAYSAGQGVLLSVATTGSITGNVYGSPYNTPTCPGVDIAAGATMTIVGKAVGGASSYGAQNASTGILKVTRAVGNGYGAGSVGLGSIPGVYSGVQGSQTYVEEIEYGPLGQTPTAGVVFITPKTTNVALFTKSDLTQKTLYDATNLANALPAASDVRYGTVYNYSANTGTCYVPNSGSVAKGVPVDNTTGVAVLTQDAIWGTLASALSVSGSIGERLKNVSTVASTGAQLAAALSV